MVLTYNRIYIFYLETKKEEKDAATLEKLGIPASKEDEKASSVVRVRDPQVYDLMDFEFIQKLQDPKTAFILKTYNKEMTD